MKKISNPKTAAKLVVHAFWYLFYTRKGSLRRIAAENEILSRAWLSILHPENDYSGRNRIGN